MSIPNSDYVAFFGTELGRKVLAELSLRFLTAPTYTKGDPYHTTYLSGRSEAVRWLINKADPKHAESEEDAETPNVL